MATGLKETLFTPSVKIIPEEHRIIISGQSKLEDPSPFYEKLVIILDDTINEFKTHTSIDFILINLVKSYNVLFCVFTDRYDPVRMFTGIPEFKIIDFPVGG